MIRFLQKDNRVVKIVFIAIIAVAVVTMVITLVPGIFADTDTSSDGYATVRSGGFMGRYFGTSATITTPEVQQVAERILQQNRYPDMMLPYIMPQAAQALIQREVLLQEANRLGLQVSDVDLRRAMQTGPFSRALFPGGQFIGEDNYAELRAELLPHVRPGFRNPGQERDRDQPAGSHGDRRRHRVGPGRARRLSPAGNQDQV